MHNDSTLVEENQRFVRKGLINIIKTLNAQLEEAKSDLSRNRCCNTCAEGG